MKTSTVLKKAKRLLETKGWTKGYVARDKAGNCVPACSRAAVCFCAVGAIERAAGGIRDPRLAPPDGYDDAESMLHEVMPSSARCAGLSVGGYNDATRRTVKQILSLFDRAIARAESLEATS